VKLARIITALLLTLAIPMPALAQPHVIAELGTAPLIGQISSTSQLQADVTQQRRLFERAGTKLGLTPDEYAQFSARISSRRLAYVTIPRKLDAMTWSSGGRVYVLHDVVIPAHTKGWEIDLQEQHQIVALFIPARCGNLSVLRKPMPALAQAAPAKAAPAKIAPAPVVAVEAAATAPPQPMPETVALPAAPAATPAPYTSIATATPATHHARLWPLLLIPIIALLASHHGGSSIPAVGSTTLTNPPGAATPPPASCPTPAPSH
jgi:hypothetical protein